MWLSGRASALHNPGLSRNAYAEGPGFDHLPVHFWHSGVLFVVVGCVVVRRGGVGLLDGWRVRRHGFVGFLTGWWGKRASDVSLEAWDCVRKGMYSVLFSVGL